MITETAWRRILYVATGLVIMAVLIIAFFVIPQVKADTSPGAAPETAAKAFWVFILIQLLPVAALLYTLIFSHREGHFINGFLIAAGVILILLSLILIDAATAFLGHKEMSTIAIFLFISIGFDFIAGVLSFIARYFRGHLLSEK
jgi:hypothetical protein